jgi:nicotinamidase-related amidase
MKKTLIVVDMQNDFISGSLGTLQARAIVANVKNKIDEYRANGNEVIFTRDTHFADYSKTLEGKYLKTKHCIEGTDGWEIANEVDVKECKHINKPTFGYVGWARYNFEKIEIVGLCTDICVISNALMLKTLFPDVKITVDANCCAGTTPKNHKAALAVMKSCCIDVIEED